MPPNASRLLQALGRRSLHSTRSLCAGQDMPPVGGYEAVQYKRNLPVKGFRPRYLFIVFGLVSVYGWYRLKVGVDEWNELAREKTWARIFIIPLLQAEEDRDQVRRYYANRDRERELLGTETKVYHSDKFIRPTYSIAPPVTKDD